MLMRHMHMGIIMDIMIAYCFILMRFSLPQLSPVRCWEKNTTLFGGLSTLFDIIHCFPFVFDCEGFVNSCVGLAIPLRKGYNIYV